METTPLDKNCTLLAKLCVIFAVVTGSVFSCNKNDLHYDEEQLIGTWRWVSTEFYTPPYFYEMFKTEDYYEYTIQIKDNGKYRIHKNGKLEEKGTLKIRSYVTTPKLFFQCKWCAHHGFNQDIFKCNKAGILFLNDTILIGDYPYGPESKEYRINMTVSNYFVRE